MIFNKKATCLRVVFLLPRPKAACSGLGGAGHPDWLLIYSWTTPRLPVDKLACKAMP